MKAAKIPLYVKNEKHNPPYLTAGRIYPVVYANKAYCTVENERGGRSNILLAGPHKQGSLILYNNPFPEKGVPVSPPSEPISVICELSKKEEEPMKSLPESPFVTKAQAEVAAAEHALEKARVKLDMATALAKFPPELLAQFFGQPAEKPQVKGKFTPETAKAAGRKGGKVKQARLRAAKKAQAPISKKPGNRAYGPGTKTGELLSIVRACAEPVTSPQVAAIFYKKANPTHDERTRTTQMLSVLRSRGELSYDPYMRTWKANK